MSSIFTKKTKNIFSRAGNGISVSLENHFRANIDNKQGFIYIEGKGDSAQLDKSASLTKKIGRSNKPLVLNFNKNKTGQTI